MPRLFVVIDQFSITKNSSASCGLNITVTERRRSPEAPHGFTVCRMSGGDGQAYTLASTEVRVLKTEHSPVCTQDGGCSHMDFRFLTGVIPGKRSKNPYRTPLVLCALLQVAFTPDRGEATLQSGFFIETLI